MLEIQEIECLARRLDVDLRGEIIQGVRLAHWYEQRRGGSDQIVSLVGWTITSVCRRGKALVFSFENPGIGNRYLATRFGMSSNWCLLSQDRPKQTKSLVCEIALGVGYLTFQDKRRTAGFEVSGSMGELQSISNYGPDLLGPIAPDWLWFCCRRHRVPVKALLVRPEYFAGVGNSLACEALFRANVHPETLGSELSQEQASRLMAVLLRTIEAWVSAADHGDGDLFQVYGREAKPCYICATPISKRKISGRACYFCSVCQSPDWRPNDPVSQEFIEMVVQFEREITHAPRPRGAF